MRFRALVLLVAAVSLSGCATFSARDASTVPLVSHVDIDRFMGDWYVIAHIPTDRDRASHNAIETYSKNPDGSIATVYTNRLGGFDGEPKRLTPTMTVMPDSGNALWAVRFGWYWPFAYEYRVSHLEPDYSAAIIARSKLDYLWIFSRKPTMSDQQLTRYKKLITSWGYDASKLEKVPQQTTRRSP